MATPEDYKAQFYTPSIHPEQAKFGENVSSAKYTCRFDIQIANDKEFQVARKLIGAKGCNMKRILDLCSKGCSCPVQEVIKLRLRGRGSGFKEGPSQQESDDPLHLCISSRYYEKYVMARQLARELILDVYEDHKRFCERTGKEVLNLQIKLTENVSGVRGQRHGTAHCKGAPGGNSVRPHQMYYNNGPPMNVPQYYYEGGPMSHGTESIPPYYPSAAYPPSHAPYYGYEQAGMYRQPYPDPYAASHPAYPGHEAHHSYQQEQS